MPVATHLEQSGTQAEARDRNRHKHRPQDSNCRWMYEKNMVDVFVTSYNTVKKRKEEDKRDWRVGDVGDGDKVCAHGSQMETQWWKIKHCLLYTSPSPRDPAGSRMPSSA